MSRSQERFKSVIHNAFTEEMDKIASSSNDDNSLQNFKRISSYPFFASAEKVYKIELQQNLKIKT